jgi:hypothetical protein
MVAGTKLISDVNKEGDMVFDWLLNKAVKRSSENKVKELQNYLNILRDTPDFDRGFIVVLATVTRLQMQENDILPSNLFEGPAGVKNNNSYERANVALKLSQIVEHLQRENRIQDAAAVMIWAHSVRGLVTPEMVPLVKEMWAELSKGFVYIDDGIATFEALKGDSLTIADSNQFNFVPPQFI